MKSFTNYAAQGDFFVRRIDKLPKDVVPVEPVDGKIVVAHSETGHDHVMVADRVKAFVPKKPDIYQMFIQVDEPTPVEHLRSFDTHAPLMFDKGTYEIKRQREHTPEGWRRAAD